MVNYDEDRRKKKKKKNTSSLKAVLRARNFPYEARETGRKNRDKYDLR